MVVLPNLDILRYLFLPGSEVWSHIRKYLLGDYISNTLLLTAGTLTVTLILGTFLAWLVSVYDFPGRRALSILLILPLAVPPYILAYTYSGILGYTGFLQVFLRNRMGIVVDQGYFSIMNLPGAIFIFSLTLYPYVYLIARAAFRRTSGHLAESARLLGSRGGELLFRVLLPLAVPSLVAAATVVALEVISDYGVVSYFGIQVFSTAIFRAWISFGDIGSALKLSAWLLLFVILIHGSQMLTRRREILYGGSARPVPFRRIRLNRKWSAVALSASGLVLFIALILPLGQMVAWSIFSAGKISLGNLGISVWNTFWLSAVSASAALAMVIVLAAFQRISGGRLSRIFSRVAVIGYAIPGTVVGLTVLLFFLDMDSLLGTSFRGGILVLIYAYVLRFLAVSHGNVQSGFTQAGIRHHEASRLLGRGPLQTLLRVDLPMIRQFLLSGFILTFVDMVKELPMVLILRPFNFSTLSTRVFEYAHDEMIPESALFSLTIVLVSFVAVYLLQRTHGEPEGEME